MAIEEAYRLAGRQLGLDETEQNAALREFMANGGVNLDPATTAWCAAFVNASLQQAGLQGTNSLAARSFENWGVGTESPRPGDIAVFRRGDEEWMGHVGFFHGFDENGNVLVLGGNQGDSVSVKPYSRNALLGFRTMEGRGEMEPLNAGGGSIGNAFGFGQPAPQNAMAGQRPQMPPLPQMPMQDPAAFMRQPNALAAVPFQSQNYLTRRLG
jgi:uncharacterized protein (TIGR02594 family)